MRLGLSNHRGLVKMSAGLNVPVVGLGASAANYYPAVGNHLNCDMILPKFGGVANALGAVVGRMSIQKSGSITAPNEGVFRVHFPDGVQDFLKELDAFEGLEEYLRKIATEEARSIGAQDIHIKVEKEIKKARVEGREIFVEAMLRVIATARPRIT